MSLKFMRDKEYRDKYSRKPSYICLEQADRHYWNEHNIHFDTLDEYIEYARQRSEDKYDIRCVMNYNSYYSEEEEIIAICVRGVCYEPINKYHNKGIENE